MSAFAGLLQARTLASSSQTLEMSLEDYLQGCAKHPLMWASSQSRLLSAIGEPEMVDTSKDTRLGRLFASRTIRRYPAFADFFGMEETIERIVGFIRNAAQGGEERRQIMYLLGPVGCGKSSLAERLKSLMEVHPMYVLVANGKPSPVFESPLGLFQMPEEREYVCREFGISRNMLEWPLSPWALQRLQEFSGDISRFSVLRMHLSQARREGIAKVVAGDSNKQSSADLTGLVDSSESSLPREHADRYSYTGGLCRANQGMLEFAEMFKARKDVLHPFLTVTTEGVYAAEAIGELPFQGLIMAHSNLSEWTTFKDNPDNKGLVDRTYVVKIPYCLRITEEVEILKKFLRASELGPAPQAPRTLETLATFGVMTRLSGTTSPSILPKALVYDGELPEQVGNTASTYEKYRTEASDEEGFVGMSPRKSRLVLADAFNRDAVEVAASPKDVLDLLGASSKNREFAADYKKHVDLLTERYLHFLGLHIQQACVEDYANYGPGQLTRYVTLLNALDEKSGYKDPDTGEVWDDKQLLIQLERVEVKAKIPASEVKEFRHKILRYCLTYQSNNRGKMPPWLSDDTYKRTVDNLMTMTFGEIWLKVVPHRNRDTKEKKEHEDFLVRMKALCYTSRQIRALVDWWITENI